jgi:NADH:ubiquinone oxidoreductase subunit F (NADH-binding)
LSKDTVLKKYAALVMDEDADVVDVLQNVLHYYSRESCGHCAPCRVGTSMLVKIIDRLASFEGEKDNLDQLLKISKVMRDTSFCPVGQAPYSPISSALRNFQDQLLQHVK